MAHDLPDMLLRSNRFREIEFVGRGAFGAVYRAVDRESGTVVAIKSLLDLSPEWIYRLKLEFRSLRGLLHRNVVQF